MRKPKPAHVFRKYGAEVRVNQEGNFFRITWYVGDQRQREKRIDENEAIRRAKEILASLVEGKDTDEEKVLQELAYLRSLQEKLGGIPLHRIVDDYIAAGNRRRVQPKRVDELLPEFLGQLEQDKASPGYYRTIRRHIRPFALKYPGIINEITSIDLDQWLRQRAPGPRTRNNIRSSLITFFRWARDSMKALPAEQATEPELVRKALDKGAHQRVELWTPDEMRRLLKLAEPLTYAVIVLGAFCGIRTSEITGEETDHPAMNWEDILWDHRQIRVGWQKVDSKERRYVPMPENVVALLEPFRKCKGLMWLYGRSEDRFMRLAEKAGLTWKRNANRKSYISYRTATTRDPARVADEAGTSAQKIRSNYRRPELEQDAHKWSQIGLEKDDANWIRTVWERATAHDKKQAQFFEIAPFLHRCNEVEDFSPVNVAPAS